jgi:lysophospholipase L1-like esterase
VGLSLAISIFSYAETNHFALLPIWGCRERVIDCVMHFENRFRAEGTRFMSKRSFAVAFSVVVLVAVCAVGNSQSTDRQKWLGTWATAPMLADGSFREHASAGGTLREIVHISNGGQQVRVRFTNEFGLDPLTISDAHVAVSAGGAAIKEGTDHALTFGGAASVRIPPGAAMYSDPVPLVVEPLSDVAVSFFLPRQNMRGETAHLFSDQDNFVADGDQSAAAALNNPTTLSSWYFLDGIDVPLVNDARAIVTLGDSITDGAHSTKNANRRWPDVLALRLKQEHGLENVSVLNEGIGGNRVLNEQTGPSALSRLDRDVLAQNGVRYLIVLESINDIGRLAKLAAPEDEVTAQQLEEGLRQIADAAHQHGIKAFGATLTPYGGAGYFSDRGEQVRKDVNNWIRTSGAFDGVIDFDQITRDAQNPDRFNPLHDSGDHLHPGDAGYKAMGDGIDLNLFK